jgi:polyisoprenoid-binding protein YceI
LAFRLERTFAHRTFIAASVVALALAGCAAQIARPPVGEDQRPAGFPDTFYEQLAQRGAVVLPIDSARSLVVIEARRAGTLANLGHDHIVASHDVRGYVAPNDARADLYIRLDRLDVDEPDMRAQAGFDTQPSEAAIAGTRENMLRKFNAENHPYAVISVAGVDADAADPGLNASITLNGITRAMRIPVKIERAADQLTVTGHLTVAQTAFGITPYSILGGALQVQDQVDVRFAIRARNVLP